MLKHLTSVSLSGVLLTGCLPGPLLRSPPVVGRVVDARTGEGLPGTRITLALPGENPTAMPLPDAVSDARGRFSLEAQYKLGLAVVYGDPPLSRIVVRFSKEGYGDAEVRSVYPLHSSSRGALHADAALEPEPIKKDTHL